MYRLLQGMGRRGILIYLCELLYVDESQLKFNFVFRRNLFAIKGVNIYSSTAQSFWGGGEFLFICVKCYTLTKVN